MAKKIKMTKEQWNDVNGWLEDYKEELYENYKASEDEKYENENIRIEKFIDKVRESFNLGKEEIELTTKEANNIVQWLDEYAEELYENFKANPDEQYEEINIDVNNFVNSFRQEIKKIKNTKK